jgi:hypothetical protein
MPFIDRGEEKSSMPEREVSFYSEGVKVYGTLNLPREGEISPAVVLVHGYGSFRDELTGFVEIASKLSGCGIASLRIDLRGCGKSGEPGRIHPFSEWIVDVGAAVSFLQTENQVDGKRIGLGGMSVGGGTVFWAGGLDPRVKCIVALAPVADGEWWLRHLWTNRGGDQAWNGFFNSLEKDLVLQATHGYSKKVSLGEMLAYGPEDERMMEEMLNTYPQFTREVYLSSAVSLLNFKPRLVAGLIESTPLRLIHSRDDTSVPAVHSEKLHKQTGKNGDLKIIFDSPHCFWVGPQSEKVQELTIEWLMEYL